jgi:hypothetical protein
LFSAYFPTLLRIAIRTDYNLYENNLTLYEIVLYISTYMKRAYAISAYLSKVLEEKRMIKPLIWPIN